MLELLSEVLCWTYPATERTDNNEITLSQKTMEAWLFADAGRRANAAGLGNKAPHAQKSLQSSAARDSMGHSFENSERDNGGGARALHRSDASAP